MCKYMNMKFMIRWLCIYMYINIYSRGAERLPVGCMQASEYEVVKRWLYMCKYMIMRSWISRMDRCTHARRGAAGGCQLVPCKQLNMESWSCRLDMCKYVNTKSWICRVDICKQANMKSWSCGGRPIGCMRAVEIPDPGGTFFDFGGLFMDKTVPGSL